MKTSQRTKTSTSGQPIEKRLAAYLTAAGAVGTVMASEAQAIIVFNQTPQPISINGAVDIDFNGDGQIDYQIDHDRVNLGGTDLDYLQIDKNDVNGHTNPLDFPVGEVTFPVNGTVPNDSNDSAYVNSTTGAYPSALTAGTPIGPTSTFDFQEGNNYDSTGAWIRANRLIDEDATQIDQQLGGRTPGGGAGGVLLPSDGPNFVGLGGETAYLGLRMELNAADPDTNFYNYGWIGIRIDNEADATGAVTGWAYETEVGVAIGAGVTGLVGDYNGDGAINAADYTIWRDTLGSSTDLRADGDNNTIIDQLDYAVWTAKFGTAGSGLAAAVPEPGSMVLAALGGLAILAAYAARKWFP